MAAKKKKVVPSLDSSDHLKFIEGLKRQWVATIDALVDPLMIVDKSFKIVKANRAMADMAGFDVRTIVGKTCYRSFAGRESPCDGCSMLKAAKSGKSHNFHLADIRDSRTYEVSSQPILDAQGVVEGVVQVYRDRTDAISLQEKLMQTEKLASIGLLAGGVAHEINNPLGGIMVFSQMLLREMSPDDPHHADVREIENAAQRCKVIVENLLEFARGKPAKKGDANAAIDAVESLHSALRFAKISLSWRNVHLDDTTQVEKLFCSVERNKLIQVFLNLLQNATQAMPNGGTLTLRSGKTTHENKAYIFIEVIDTGTGISGENLKHIFDPFFTTKDPGEGTGLGLAICYGIVQDSGGTIDVKTKVGVGTTFRVLLPERLQRGEVKAS